LIFNNPPIPQLIGLLLAVVVGTTVHEFMHAYVADSLGDRLPRRDGRISLNPVDHLDPVGTIFFLLAGFGWGKPVMVNSYALRPGRIGMAYVAAAGPLANLALAMVVAVGFRAANLAGILGGSGDFGREVLLWVVQFNVILGLFNLLPVPPLDGHNLVLPFLSPRTEALVRQYTPYGVIILLVLVLLPQLSGGVSPLRWLFDLATAITRFLVGA
jgi:Zn-dependent protease